MPTQSTADASRSDPEFRVELTSTDAECRLGVIGELDACSVGLFSDAVECALVREHHLVVDLHEVTFCDVAGLNALLAARRVAWACGGRCQFCGAAPLTAKILRLGSGDRV